jgi:hypothetical protein
MGLIERFAGQVLGYYTGGMTAYMIDIGHRTGQLDNPHRQPRRCRHRVLPGWRRRPVRVLPARVHRRHGPANRNTFDEHLVADFMPLVPGLAGRLRAGASPTPAAAPATPCTP